jgi:hypothetical protein
MGLNHPACWSRIWAQNTAKSIRTTATQCNKLDGSTSLTCSYATDRTEGDRDRLAHNPDVVADKSRCLSCHDFVTTRVAHPASRWDIARRFRAGEMGFLDMAGYPETG